MLKYKKYKCQTCFSTNDIDIELSFCSLTNDIIEDCEVCCNPNTISYTVEDQKVVYFEVEKTY